MKFVIGVGSNSADKKQRMDAAIEYLASWLDEFECSSVYSTRAFNGIDADYLNAVVCGCCCLPVEEVVSRLKEYESASGRNHSEKNVVIDLDLVLVDDYVLRPRDMEREYFLLGYRELMGNCHEPSSRILR